MPKAASPTGCLPAQRRRGPHRLRQARPRSWALSGPLSHQAAATQDFRLWRKAKARRRSARKRCSALPTQAHRGASPWERAWVPWSSWLSAALARLAAGLRAGLAPGWEQVSAAHGVHSVRPGASHCLTGLARRGCGLRQRAAGGNRAGAQTRAREWSYSARARAPCPQATARARSAATTPQCFPAPSSCLSFCFRDPVP